MIFIYSVSTYDVAIYVAESFFLGQVIDRFGCVLSPSGFKVFIYRLSARQTILLDKDHSKSKLTNMHHISTFNILNLKNSGTSKDDSEIDLAWVVALLSRSADGQVGSQM